MFYGFITLVSNCVAVFWVCRYVGACEADKDKDRRETAKDNESQAAGRRQSCLHCASRECLKNPHLYLIWTWQVGHVHAYACMHACLYLCGLA